MRGLIYEMQIRKPGRRFLGTIRIQFDSNALAAIGTGGRRELQESCKACGDLLKRNAELLHARMVDEPLPDQSAASGDDLEQLMEDGHG